MTFSIPTIDPSVVEKLNSPSLLVFADEVERNIEQMVATAGNVDRLRPHCKTHKMTAVIKLLLQRGIQKHKAATIAESEMLAEAGAVDIVFAYNPVGPNIDRVVQLIRKYPQTKFTVTADHETPLRQLSKSVSENNVVVGVMLDLDVGLHRTGISSDSEGAPTLYRLISELPGIRPAGFHVYDGHQHQPDLEERSAAVLKEWPAVLELMRKCKESGLDVPELLCGGTPTFPIYAQIDVPEVTLSPGTSIFHDAGYGGNFPDLPFTPAAILVSRVISRPTANRLTLDLGNKAVAADPPKGHRVYFPELPDAEQVIHNEEHLVLETDRAEQYEPGNILLGIPMHVCPTSALHQDVAVVYGDGATDSWEVTARNRRLSV